MISKIDISNFDDEIYNFDTFECIWTDQGWYILTDDYFFELKSIDDIKQEDDHYIIVSEDKEDKFVLTMEDYQIIANLLLDKNKN